MHKKIPIHKANKVLEIYNITLSICDDCVVKVVCDFICESFNEEFQIKLKEKYPIYKRDEFKDVPGRILRNKYNVEGID